jgi:hypothetical protein
MAEAKARAARALTTRTFRWTSAVAVLATFAVARAAPLTPEETVRRYLEAMKEKRFDAAYDLVSKAMRQGKEREVWVKEQQVGMAWAEVRIFEFEVYPAKVEGDKAYVPNVLSSQDRFINQLGLTEHELYTLVREDGAWKVDQQLIVEPANIPKWFPEKRPGKVAAGAAPVAPAAPTASH